MKLLQFPLHLKNSILIAIDEEKIMRDTEQSILNVFKDNPTREYNTSELAKEVFPEEYTTIEESSVKSR